MSENKATKKLTIIGLGLIGSSMARGLKGKYHITGCNRNFATTKKALADGVIDRAADKLQQAVADAEIVVLATPMGMYESIMNEISQYLQPGTIITDVGSVKTPAIFQVYKSMPPGVHFVPAHPIAGKETTGYEAGDAKLFAGKRVILTPLPKTPYEVNLEIENLWKELGAIPETMTAAEHDKIYAAISHVPQLLAYAYQMAVRHKKYNAVPEEEGEYKTFTRIAHSQPDIWVDIFQLNRAHIFKFLDKMFNGLTHIDKFCDQVELRQKLGGKPLNFKLKDDKKLDAAAVVFPALLGNLILFCIEDEFESQSTRSFSAADIHASLAMLETPQEKKEIRNFADYAGTGLRDFTVCSLYDVSEIVEGYAEEIQLLKILLHRKIFEITVAIESDSAEQLKGKLLEANQLPVAESKRQTSKINPA